MSPDLKIGTIFAVFRLPGTIPVLNDWFIIWAIGASISSVVLQRIIVEMLSNPELFLILRVCYCNYVQCISGSHKKVY